ncbi:related to nuclear protein ES2 [Cephalotrichum gorgonifer]|uniref:Related to nuclear protein ES2 n=1 Tax=Cephalotrichum gorgonifer TaxID=2041049 RepID=A0AAE8SRI6_9PEZI|nr:related to nuclear protein ES2 [Cephalotrichum gorgonifer]
MGSPASASTALIRKRTDTDLMPPPPQAKRIKRPRKVIDEDSYTEALSRIIARDFFPGLQETEAQHEYLDALDSKDRAWIGRADQRLREALTPARRATQPATPSASTVVGGRTPSVYGGATPASVAGSVVDQKSEIDINVSLGKFQATYTSEDNESFYRLVDKQNQKHIEKTSWVWNGNKLPSKQMLKQREINDRLLKEGKEEIVDRDSRPARPDSWNAHPKNALMFPPDGVDDDYKIPERRAQAASSKTIVYENTRVPLPIIPPRPSSPTLSAIRDAVNGDVREIFQTDSLLAGGDETPNVNGYRFVDDEDEPAVPDTPLPLIDLGSGDATPNPFKIQEHRKRETLHRRMVPVKPAGFWRSYPGSSATVESGGRLYAQGFEESVWIGDSDPA